MTADRQNFSGLRTPAPPFDEETEFIECNFSQNQPVERDGNMVGVRLWPDDDTPRTFTKCNLMNAEPPPGSTIDGGLTVIKTTGVVYEGDVDIVSVNGIEIARSQITHDFVHGRLLPDGTYDYSEATGRVGDRREEG